MSRTRQPRTNHSQDADEERRLWTQIKAEAKKIDALISKSATIGTDIVEIEKQQAALVEADKPSDAANDDQLEALYREDVRINEQIQHMIEGQSNEMSLLETIRILQALREAAEEPLGVAMGRSTSTNGSKPRSGAAMAKRKAAAISSDDLGVEDISSTAAAAAPSPRVASGRLAAQVAAGATTREKSVRGGSAAPSFRETSVKIEDGAESVASSVDGVVGPSSKAGSEAGSMPPSSAREARATPSAPSAVGTPLTPSGGGAGSAGMRNSLVAGVMVFYRNKGRAQEGEGILCRVTSVIGEGKQRRYEIQDADPDPQPGTGESPAPYRASVANLVAIPTSNIGLGDLMKGKHVLAQYPDTTTFYKAEVSTSWRQKDINTDKGMYVRLRFEGEMEEAKETEVERRFVITDFK